MEKRRILLSGASGFVGSRICARFSPHHALTAFPTGFLRRASEDAFFDYVYKAKPEVMVHTAAISDMGECERSPEDSHRANVMLTEWMARAAMETGAKLLCFGSDQVYSQCAGDAPHTEAETPRSGSVYGAHKIEGERRALAICPSAVMLRATWMYDFPAYGAYTSRNLLTNLLVRAAQDERTGFSTHDFRGITYVRQVVDFLEPAMDLPGGAYNFGSDNARNMYDTACDFLSVLGLSHRIEALVERDDRAPARNLRMNPEKLARYGICFDDTAAGLRRCLADYPIGR